MNKLKVLRWLLILVAWTIVGCSLNDLQKQGSGAPSAGRITKEELREQLSGFTSFFKSTLNTAADEIEQKSGSKKDQMISLQMRAKMLQGLYTMSQEEDPVAAFIDTWALCTRFRIYLEEGDGANLFGANQSIATAAAKRIETHIEGIVSSFLTETDFRTSQKDIVEFARTNPIKANFSNLVAYAAPATGGSQGPFANIIGIPLAPFRGVEGVERTAAAVSKFTDTADRFSDVVADLPESSRWQLLLFLYELEETEMSKSLVSSTAKLAEASRNLAESTEQLPENIRQQLSRFVTEIDQKQANLQATLVQTEKTAAIVSNALDKVKQGADTIDAAAKSVTETAKAWQDAAGATGDAIREAAKLVPEQKSNEPRMSAKDIQTLASQITQAAGEIRATAADLKAISGMLTWRIIEVIIVILIAALIYRIVMIKITKTPAPKENNT